MRILAIILAALAATGCAAVLDHEPIQRTRIVDYTPKMPPTQICSATDGVRTIVWGCR